MHLVDFARVGREIRNSVELGYFLPAGRNRLRIIKADA